jgi:two-component system phosphate regulon sensor histidine kinase PhoR
VQLDVQDGLPPVQGDFPQLVQMIDNLLSNAVRYGCVAPECKIRASAQADGQWVRIDVSDTGPGIPRDHLPFITRRFYRVDEARSRDSGGTGLGLAIVKHVVERHRGSLSIDSKIGEGTIVTVRLPVAG